MLWATRHEPHLDRCASAWLIKRYIDRDALFVFVNRGEDPPSDSIRFVLPGATINPVEEASTAYDALAARYAVKDPVALKIGALVHDYEVNAKEDVERLRIAEAAGLFKIVRGLARISKSDQEIIDRAMVVFDSLRAQIASEETRVSPA